MASDKHLCLIGCDPGLQIISSLSAKGEKRASQAARCSVNTHPHTRAQSTDTVTQYIIHTQAGCRKSRLQTRHRQLAMAFPKATATGTVRFVWKKWT